MDKSNEKLKKLLLGVPKSKQVAIYRDLGISRATWWRYKKGRTPVPFTVLFDLAKLKEQKK